MKLHFIIPEEIDKAWNITETKLGLPKEKSWSFVDFDGSCLFLEGDFNDWDSIQKYIIGLQENSASLSKKVVTKADWKLQSFCQCVIVLDDGPYIGENWNLDLFMNGYPGSSYRNVRNEPKMNRSILTIKAFSLENLLDNVKQAVEDLLL